MNYFQNIYIIIEVLFCFNKKFIHNNLLEYFIALITEINYLKSH